MLTRNLYAIHACHDFGLTVPGVAILQNGTAVNVEPGNAIYQPLAAAPTLRLNATTAGLVVGSGTTPATADDYKLEAQITSGLSGTSGTWDMRLVDNGVELVQSLIIKNTSSEDITISEVGKASAIYYYKSSTSTSFSTGYALVDHTVLDTPITIPAGEHKTVTYTIRLNWPS